MPWLLIFRKRKFVKFLQKLSDLNDRLEDHGVAAFLFARAVIWYCRWTFLFPESSAGGETPARQPAGRRRHQGARIEISELVTDCHLSPAGNGLTVTN